MEQLLELSPLAVAQSEQQFYDIVSFNAIKPSVSDNHCS